MTVNGKEWIDFDKEKETITLNGLTGTVAVTAKYGTSETQVLQGQFRRSVEEAESLDGAKEWREQFRTQNDDHPIANVSWQDAVEFCKWLGTKEGQTYRLPTEAEWEYACRAGTQTRFSFGDDDNDLGEHAWFSDYSGSGTHPIGQRMKPNAWGLYDMHGNVSEWCADWYDAKYYASSPQEDPPRPTAGSLRVFRGGGWNHVASSCRASCRAVGVPGHRSGNRGFRVARPISSSSK